MLKNIKSLILSVLLYGVALYLVNQYMPAWFSVESVEYSVILTFLILALLFWVINNIIKIILKILTIPLKYLTFGLFSLVLNMFIIYLFEYFINNSDLGIIIHLGTFVQTFILSLYVAIASSIIKRLT